MTTTSMYLAKSVKKTSPSFFSRHSLSVAHLTTTSSVHQTSSTSTTPAPQPQVSSALPSPAAASRDCSSTVSRPCRLRSPQHAPAAAATTATGMLGSRYASRFLRTSASSSPLSRRTLMHGAAAAMPMRSDHIPLSIAATAAQQRARSRASRLWPSHSGIEDFVSDGDVADIQAEQIIGSDAKRLELASHDAPMIMSPKKALREKAFLNFDVGTAAYPHPRRMRTGSEDAFFTSRRTGSFVSSGVADGVASVRLKYGLDPSKFSRALCDGAHQLSNARLSHYDLKCLPTPLEMSNAAIDYVRSNDVKGCATLTVVTLNGYFDEDAPFDPNNPAGELNSLSLGDSQFIVIHNDMVAHKAYFQQHGFGHPYQIGHGKGLQNDSLDEAISTRLPIYDGDTVIIGSDGLFDNVHDADILSMTRGSNSLQRPASCLAMQLANLAYETSTDRNADTPYSMAASKHLEHPFSGGNRDDITVIVAKVHGLENPSLF